ncbi:hypothetical protein [Streptomyces turgidiscabies]|uniref:Uncharacterized protein n=1 Tax=Streptomyces turgidiscabies TaxID=85558 RepID=A0ABU0RSY2_9ACTN|nr:hypothetical protein [Streptomyces turgidiscabies]MDQ0935107.1 hypothetical protein [Streptomyces turgidiscabies]
MKSVGRKLRNATVVLTMGGAALSMAIQPAAAHSGYWHKSRSGCSYSGGLSALHNYAWTTKDSGGCSGHAWLQVQYSNGAWSAEVHESGSVSISTGTNGISHAYHKTQSGEGWGQSH